MTRPASRPREPASRAFPRRIEERQLLDRREGALAAMLHRHLDLDFGARRGMRGTDVPEREILLQQRRPGAARRVTDLRAASINRMARAPGDVRHVRREPAVAMETLEAHPVDLQADERP